MIWIASTHSSLIAASAAVAVARGPPILEVPDLVEESAPLELRRVRGDDRVVQEIPTGEVGVPVAVGHRAVHVCEQSRVPPSRTRSRHHGTSVAGR